MEYDMESLRKRLGNLSKDRSGGAGAVVAIIVVLALVGGAGYFFVLNGNHATTNITVQSTHLVADTDVTVYVDGKNIGSWKVSNLRSAKIAYDYSWSILDGDSKIIEIKAISTGGLLGAQEATKLVTVHKGESASVTLLV